MQTGRGADRRPATTYDTGFGIRGVQTAVSTSSNSYLAALGHEALLPIRGPDATRFLQGQVTCDTRRLAVHQAMPGAYCTPQGRVICDFLLSAHAEEHVILRLRQSVLATSAAAFGKYIVFSRADLDQEQSGWRICGCWGDGARAALAGTLPGVPEGEWQSSSGAGYTVVALTGDRFECYFHGARGEALFKALAGQTHTAPAAQWQALELRSGIARIEAATSGMFVPQMLNYDLSGHISFDKGCYTGQEVVARLHYRGTPKRRLYLASGPAGQVPEPGATLYQQGSDKPTGNVVNAVADGDAADGALILATATVATADQGVSLQENADTELRLVPHPCMPDDD